MTRGEQLAQVVQDFIGTRFWLMGRTPGTEDGCQLDCVGVVFCGAAFINMPLTDPPRLEDSMESYMDRVSQALDDGFDIIPLPGPLEVGDVLEFRVPTRGLKNKDTLDRHAAVYIGRDQIVHAVARKDVRVTVMDYKMLENITKIRRIKEIV